MSDRMAPDEARTLMGEIIGASIEIVRSPGLQPLPLRGTIVNETLGLLWVRPLGRHRVVRVPKTGLEATILVEDKQLSVSGESLKMRPEDRTKRLAPRGHGRTG